MSRKRAKQKKDKAKLVSINIWYRHTACVYKIVFNNLLVETLWKLLGRRTYSQRVVSFTDKFLFAFCFSIWQHYGNHVSICWFKLKLERFPKNPVLFLNKAVVPKAIYCFVSVFFYPSTVCIMRDRVLRKSYRKVSAIAQRKKKLDMIILLCSRQKAKNAKNNDFAMWKLESLFSPPKKFRWLRSPNYMQICHTNVWLKNLTSNPRFETTQFITSCRPRHTQLKK